MCYVFRMCVLRRMEFQLFSLLALCGLWCVFLCWQFLLSLTTLSLRAVDSSKVVGGLPREEMSEVFAQTWDKLFSRSRVQDKHSKVSSMPAALYLGPHIITGQQQLLTTTEKSQWQFSGLYISFFFKETSLFDWRLVRASVRYFSRTLVAGRRSVGWGGAYLIIVFVGPLPRVRPRNGILAFSSFFFHLGLSS